MDFTKKDSRAAAETAQFLQLRWPESGDYIIGDDGKPVGVMVLGAMARSVQSKLRDDARAKLQAAKDEDEQVKALEDIQRDLVESASKLTTGFVNVQRGKDDAKAPDDCAWFYDLNMFNTSSVLSPQKSKWQKKSFAQQVLDFSNDAANFLGND